jgi:hypothetical protein
MAGGTLTLYGKTKIHLKNAAETQDWVTVIDRHSNSKLVPG